jgi:HEAT repeat protein
MRRLALVLLLSAIARADDLREARRLLVSPNLKDRIRGIDRLAGIDSRGAIQALEEAIRRSNTQLERITPVLDRLDIKARDAWVERYILELLGEKGSPKWRAARRRELRYEKELEAVSADVRLHFRIVKRAGDSFRNYRSPEAVERIEEGARRESNPTIRMLYIRGLGHESRERSVPTLIEFLQHKDARVRCAALRSLVPFAKRGEAREAVRALGGDPHWAVRLGVYQVMSGAPFPEAVKYLASAAGREEGELALTIDSYLEALTGQSFAQKTRHWSWWYEQNKKALQDGTWVKEPPKVADPGERKTVATFFRIPIDSRRVVFAIDFSGSMSADLELKDGAINRLLEKHGLPQTRLGYAKSELIRAIRMLPDGALFNIVGYENSARSLSGRMLKASKTTRGRAVRWVREAEAQYLTNLWDALRTAFKDYLNPSGGAARFKDLPDTIIFLTDGNATRGRFRVTDDLVDLVRIWNFPLDVVIHCVGIGKNQDRDLLSTMAAETGGYYLDLDKGLKSFKPRRRRMPGELETFKPPGEETRKALAMLKSETASQRIKGARVLAMKGKLVQGVPEALARLLADEDEEVAAAASDALAKIGKTAVPALVQALESEEDTVVEIAAGVLGGMGEEAAPAVAALVEVLKGDHVYGRVAAARALGEIGPAAREGAAAALERIVKERSSGEFYEAARKALLAITR